MKSFLLILFSGMLTYAPSHAFDNSSLFIEEATLKDYGVLQLNQGLQYLNRVRSNTYTVTGELSLKPFSITVPYNKIDNSPFVNGRNVQGFGDVLLNFRHQLINTDNVSMVPRISILLPTGDYKDALGTSALGLQINQTLSVAISKSFVSNYNLGFTLVANAKEPAGDTATTTSLSYGTSLVYFAQDNLHFLCEILGNSSESPKSGGGKTRDNTFYVIPSVRYLVNFSSGWQMVPAVAYMSGAGPSESENGAFAQLAVEKKIW